MGAALPAASTLGQALLPTRPPSHSSPVALPLPPAAGVGLFGLKSSSKVTRKLAAPNAPLGYALCLVNLVLDGYTNAAQVGSAGQLDRKRLAGTPACCLLAPPPLPPLLAPPACAAAAT